MPSNGATARADSGSGQLGVIKSPSRVRVQVTPEPWPLTPKPCPGARRGGDVPDPGNLTALKTTTGVPRL